MATIELHADLSPLMIAGAFELAATHLRMQLGTSESLTRADVLALAAAMDAAGASHRAEFINTPSTLTWPPPATPGETPDETIEREAL